ncbi:MAG: hypothetical protein IH986_08555 [Planctomycetes bacterium]|nr:hypothetical protein [Planctomycetota bacterium]
MDSFESIVQTIFEHKGYWVKTGFKVELTKEEKRKIGRPSSPRWELDVLAYKGRSNELLVIECKSYLDSTGVKADGLRDVKPNDRYKLFNEETLREIVFARLVAQVAESGSCRTNTSVKLCLAAGRVATDKDREEISDYFKSKGWGFYSDEWIKNELVKLSDSGYQDEVAIVATKLLTKGRKPVARGVSERPS